VSLLAGIMVLCTVFSIMPDAASEIVGAGNEGLTFIWVPQLFQQMPGGRFFMSLFFLALVFAAWTSLIAMIELATRALVDGGASRGRALALVLIFGFALGVPSALDAGVFANQDFVWGVGLMVSGLFFAFAVIRYGARRFRETLVNTPDSDARVGVVWEWAIYFVVVQALVLIGWWIWQVKDEPQISPFGAGLMLIEWAVALAVFLAANRWLARAGTRDASRPAEPPPASIP
jgi:NSS family neurotransmitter:Na+ symporter